MAIDFTELLNSANLAELKTLRDALAALESAVANGKLESRYSDSNAQSLVAAANANPPQAAAKATIKVLVDFGKELLKSHTPDLLESVLNELGITKQELKAAVDGANDTAAQLIALRNFCTNVRDLSSTGTLDAVREKVLVDAKNRLDEYLQKNYFNNEVVFEAAKVKLKFTSDIKTAKTPFKKGKGAADLNAELIYSGLSSPLTVKATGVRLVTSDKIVDISDASIEKPNESVLKGLVLAGLQELIPLDLPGGVKVSFEHQPDIEVFMDYKGGDPLPGFAFKAGVSVSSTGGLKIISFGGDPQTRILIGTTGYVLNIAFIEYVDDVLHPNSINITAIIAPLSDETGQTIAIEGHLFLPLGGKFLKEWSFTSVLRLLSLECGNVNGRFTLDPLKFLMEVAIPGPGGKSPLGLESIFKLTTGKLNDNPEGCIRLTEKGLFFGVDDNNEVAAEIDVAYLSAFKGKASGAFRFDGSGQVECLADAKALVFQSQATFSADWKKGFGDVTLNSVVSANLDVRGFGQITAAVRVSASIQGGVVTANANTKILGIPISIRIKVPFEAQNIEALIKDELRGKAEDIGKLVAEQCKRLVSEVEDQIKGALDSFKLAIFTLAPLLNDANEAFDAGARELKKEAEKAVEAAKEVAAAAEAAAKAAGKTAEKAVNKGIETVKGWAKKAPKVKFSLAQAPGDLDPGAVLPPLVGILPNFNRDLDAFFDKLSLIRIANKLKDKLVTDGRFSQKKPVKSHRGVDTAFDVSFDQIVVAGDFDKLTVDENDNFDFSKQKVTTAVLAFFLTGTSLTRRGEHEANADFAQWGHVRFFDGGDLAPLVSIAVSLNGQPLVDASLLHARHRIYAWLKDQILKIAPTVRFGDQTHPNGDPNDPGPEPTVDLVFDQPPQQQLPVLADTTMGIKRRAFVANDGIRIIELTPGGAAEKAGLEEGDVILNIDGIPTGTPNSAPDTERDIIRKVLEKSVGRKSVLQVLPKEAQSEDDVKPVTVSLQPLEN